MFISSQYDPIGIEDTMGIHCMKSGKSGSTLSNCSDTNMNFINGYRNKFIQDIQQLIKHNHSIWTISCCQHSYACYHNFYNVSSQKIPENTGSTVAEAIDRFVFHNERVVLVDQDPWPKNEPCAF